MAAVADQEVIKHLVVLIADGRSHCRSLLHSMLSQFEVRKIHEVGDGPTALDAIASLNPDVLIMDWELPVLDGTSMLRTLRSPGAHSYPDLPVIILSSSGERTLVHKAVELGAPHFLVWPISAKMLQDRLVSIVRKARRAALRHRRESEDTTRDGVAQKEAGFDMSILASLSRT